MYKNAFKGLLHGNLRVAAFFERKVLTFLSKNAPQDRTAANMNLSLNATAAGGESRLRDSF